MPGCEERNECFIPSVVTVAVGGEVRWVNDDSAGGTVTSGSPDTGGPDGVFDSGLMMPGTRFVVTFDEPGEYSYYSIVHPWARGVVVVTDDHGHLFVTTDKGRYSDGELIMVTGQVGQIIRGYPIDMEVLAPNGNRVGVDQIQVAGDGTFSTEIAAGGNNLWKAAGEYTVRVGYGEGVDRTTATATFWFGDGWYPPPEVFMEPEGSVIGGYAFGGMFGSVGSGPGQFMVPHAIAFGPGGIIAVADILNNRIQVFRANGTFAFEFGLEGEPGYVSYIAFGPGGIIAMSDIKNHRIQLFRPIYTVPAR